MTTNERLYGYRGCALPLPRVRHKRGLGVSRFAMYTCGPSRPPSLRYVPTRTHMIRKRCGDETEGFSQPEEL